MKKLLFILVAFSFLLAETKDSEFALFKRNISPVMKWGDNGLMLVPKATTIGKNNFYMGFNTLDAGKIQGEKIFLTSLTAMFATSEDVELGITKRAFVWDNLDYSNVSMDSFHLKARIFHLTDNLIPQIAIGVNGVSINNNDFSKSSDLLYDIYLTATSQFNYFDNFQFSITATAEKVYAADDATGLFFSGGFDIKLFEHFILISEIQGVGKDEESGIINIGTELKFEYVSLGVGMFNLTKTAVKNGDTENSNSYLMANMTFSIPFGKIFK